jgi:hypothetical protein
MSELGFDPSLAAHSRDHFTRYPCIIKELVLKMMERSPKQIIAENADPSSQIHYNYQPTLAAHP